MDVEESPSLFVSVKNKLSLYLSETEREGVSVIAASDATEKPMTIHANHTTVTRHLA